MILQHRSHNDIDIVQLSGRFAMADCAEINLSIQGMINQGHGKLIIDMEKVTFIDSSGCAVLVAAYKSLQLKAGRLVLVTSPAVQSLIELTRLHTIFEILPSQVAALEVLEASVGE